MEPDATRLPLIKVVGVSAAGKSTLVSELRRLGYNARPVSQEHSGVPDMWRRIRPPEFLIFLDVDVEGQRLRRPDVPWTDRWYEVEKARLAHAQKEADLIIDTRELEPAAILAQVVAYLQAQGVSPAKQPLPPLPRTGSVLRRKDS